MDGMTATTARTRASWPVRAGHGYAAGFAIVLAIVHVLCSPPVAALELTAAERDFIAANPEVVVGGEMDWPPLDFVEDGVYTGAAKDYLDEIAASTGLNFHIVTGYTWSQLLQKFRAKDIDMLPMIYWTEQRGRDFNLTNPYIVVRHYAFVRRGADSLRSLDDLHGRTVAIPADYASIAYLKKNYPHVGILEVPTTLDAVDAVVTGRADVVIEQLAGVSYYMRRYNISGLEPAFPIRFHVNNVHMAVRKDKPVLRDILQKALDEISAEQATEIMARWTGSEASAKTLVVGDVEFSAAEQKFLAGRSQLVACVQTGRMPYETVSGTNAEGMTADYLALLSDAVKKPVVARAVPSWRALATRMAGGTCDVVTNVTAGSGGAGSLVMTDAYASHQLGLVTGSGESYVADLEALDGQTVAVADGFVDLATLVKSYPDIRFVPVDTAAAGLAEVADGNVFGFLDHLPVLSHAIALRGGNDLKVSGSFDASGTEARMGTDPARPLLGTILAKALAGISDAQRQRIQRKWFAVTVDKHTDYTLLIRTLLGALVVVAFLWLRYWQVHRHREQIREKNAQLASINDDLEAQKRAADHRAFHDPLTGLSNRAKLTDDLDHSIKIVRRTRGRIAVLFLDLDRFKYVNDSLGHDVGDELLRVVAHLLGAQLRETDTLYRLGGDEFVVVLEALRDREAPAVVANRIIRALGQPLEIAGHSVNVGTSVGIAVCPDDSDDLNTLLKYADSAMYAAKEAGGNTLRFYRQELSDNVHQRLVIEGALRDAVRQDRFSLVFQPIVDLDRLSVVGAEALLRWCDPVLGVVPPDRFVPIAEDNGEIVPIGRRVMEMAAAALNRFDRDGCILDTLSVNVSSVEMRRGDIAAQCAEVLASAGISPRRLELEITERCVFEKDFDGESVLEKLKRAGHRIAIDDFGTGYSSLAYLKQLPVDVIKIDRSFIGSLPDDTNDVEITRAIVGLSHTLGYRVVAEGCETAEQFEFLRACRCDLAQGWFFAKPVVADEFAACVADVNTRLKTQAASVRRLADARR